MQLSAKIYGQMPYASKQALENYFHVSIKIFVTITMYSFVVFSVPLKLQKLLLELVFNRIII